MTIIYGLIGLGFIVFIHELGHFITAKICGVTVESFSIGMGPILLHKTIKGTDYRLSLIPLGGYCGMKGQKDFQVALDEKLESITGDKDSFYGIHPLKRVIIAFSGPFFNFIFAAIAFMIISMIGYSYYTSENKIIFTTTDANYDHVLLPDGNISYSNSVSYTVKTNDEYLFIIYSKLGFSDKKIIEINNIDVSKPTGSCIAYLYDSYTNVVVNAKDDSGVTSYEYLYGNKKSEKISKN